MKQIFLLLFSACSAILSAQEFTGTVFLRDFSNLYLNQVYITNLTTQKTVISLYTGEFKINANAGDKVRFTSIVTDRKDITVTKDMLEGRNNFFELVISYYDIEEVVIARFKPSKNLRADVAKMKYGDKKIKLREMIGLPESSGDGNPPQIPIASFGGGGFSLSVNSIFDAISGDKKRKERLYAYEKMMQVTSLMKNYFGDEFFIRLKIPKNLIQSFLQFVYTSENNTTALDNGNIEQSKIYIEKYLPIYLKRLENSRLIEVARGK